MRAPGGGVPDVTPPLTNADISNVWNEFGRGYYAFYVSGPWNIGEFKRRLPADRQQSWMTAPLPGPEEGAHVEGGRGRARAISGPDRACKPRQAAAARLEVALGRGGLFLRAAARDQALDRVVFQVSHGARRPRSGRQARERRGTRRIVDQRRGHAQ